VTKLGTREGHVRRSRSIFLIPKHVFVPAGSWSGAESNLRSPTAAVVPRPGSSLAEAIGRGRGAVSFDSSS